MTEALNICVNDDENNNNNNNTSNSNKMLVIIKNTEINSTSSSGSSIQRRKMSVKNMSYLGLFTCLASIVLAFLFKDSLIDRLAYLEERAGSNALEFHLERALLIVCVSLPILWGYLICVLISSYVYAFAGGFCLVVAYSALGMACSFALCRYLLYECAHQRVQSVAYLRAISAVIASNERGFQIIFLSRLMPIPFGLANTVFAVTDVHFRKYMLASVVGLVPSQLILCYMGSTLKSMSDVLVNEKTAHTAYLVFLVQLLVAVLVMYYILKAARVELSKHLNDNDTSSGSVADSNTLASGGLIVHTLSNGQSGGGGGGINGLCPFCKGNNVNCEHCQLLNTMQS